jgi:SAM-dependent methyltransferase
VLHSDRSRAGSFGEDPEQYDRSRPTYPPALVDSILASAGLSKPRGADGSPVEVLDVGCGTGIASRLFQARGCSVLGVELDARMAEVARSRGGAVEVSGFETWDPSGRSFDLVVSGQAWHWLDPVGGARKAASLLRPRGLLAPFWNVGRPTPEIEADFDELYRRVEPGLDGYSVAVVHGGPTRYAEYADGIRATRLFAEAVTTGFEWSRRYTRDEWLDQLPTHSDHRALPPARLSSLLREVGRIIDDHGGEFDMSYETVLISARVLEA